MTDSEQKPKWVFVQAYSPQWYAWKRYETIEPRRDSKGNIGRWAFVYRDPGGQGLGCDVPREWPPGYEPSAKERGWQQPQKPAQATTGGISEYLRDGGPVPGPGKHQGIHESSMPGPDGRGVMPKREITDIERRMLDWYQQQTHTKWAGRIPCSAYMRGYLDDMARKIREER